MTAPRGAGRPARAAEATVSLRSGRRAATPVLVAGGVALAAGYGVLGAGLNAGVPLGLLALGGGLVAGCGVLLWRTIDALLTPAEHSEHAPRTRGRLRELQREKQAVLRAIKEIELDYRMKKLAEADYGELLQRYRGRAVALLAEIEDGDDVRQRILRDLELALAEQDAPADGGAPGARVCEACSTRNDPDARYCKQCAHALD